jgi:Helix-turn-helix domain
MRIGSPFNPYKIFQGVFAPYWVLEHRGIGTGAKLCYIRLLGFAGKDARCYPSLETLGNSLGVSDRQARDYVKELERAGLIAAEQRGLRRTNVYFFLWTAELEKLSHSVPEGSDDPGDSPKGPIGPPADQNAPSGLDRNNRSAPNRNRVSVPDRNSSSVLGRKIPAGPIGINSVGINSLELSSSPSAVCESTAAVGKTKTTGAREPIAEQKSESLPHSSNRIGQAIIGWARARNIQRLRSDRKVGMPEKELLAQWTSIFEARGVIDDEVLVYAVLDVARAAADRIGPWRSWAFITLQIQLAAEQVDKAHVPRPAESPPSQDPLPEEPDSDWAKAKARISLQIPEIAFLNWFPGTWQIAKWGSRIEVAVPDEPTKAWLKGEYELVISQALSDLGVQEICFVVCDPLSISLENRPRTLDLDVSDHLKT